MQSRDAIMQISALVVQGIEHLRPKEGVGRSNRSEGDFFLCLQCINSAPFIGERGEGRTFPDLHKSSTDFSNPSF